MFGKRELWLPELSAVSDDLNAVSDDLNAAGYTWDAYQDLFIAAYNDDLESSEARRLPTVMPVGIAAMKKYNAAAERQDAFARANRNQLVKNARYTIGNFGTLMQRLGLGLAIMVWDRKATLGRSDPEARAALDEWSGGFQAASEGRWWVEQVVAGHQYPPLGPEQRHLVDAVGVLDQAKASLLAAYPEDALARFGTWDLS